jgi:type IV secretory pathway TraG/TraD family ATPase VirD4
VFVDEFDAFASPAFATFLNKGRSSDFMIHLAHQTLSDLNRVSPDFMGQIMGNMNVRYIFRQDSPDDAELWSRFFGTRTVIKQTYRTKDGMGTGDSSNRLTQEFRVGPDAIKELKTGECIFSVKSQKGGPERVQIPFKPWVFEPSRFKKAPKIRTEYRVLLHVEAESTPDPNAPGALVQRAQDAAGIFSEYNVKNQLDPKEISK